MYTIRHYMEALVVAGASSIRCPSPQASSLIEIRKISGGQVAVATLHGDIDLAEMPRVRARLHSAVQRAEKGLVIDVSSVKYFDSTGVALLFDVKKRLQQSGRRLSVVAAADAPIRRVLSIVNIDRYITMRATVAVALAELDGTSDAGR